VAKAGVASQPLRSTASANTRQALIEAAIETLKEHGYTGASARAVAARAGCNQALVFYHFGSVVGLLLAALDEVSHRRMERYSQAAGGITSLVELFEVAAAIFQEDVDEGYVAVLAEMIAGASSTPGLGPAVAARIQPWNEFARRAIESAVDESPIAALLPIDDLAHAVVALYLGLEMLSHLDGDRSRPTVLFEHGKRIASLLAVLAGPPTRPTEHAESTPATSPATTPATAPGETHHDS
jgi:AcrR family transcriptional regulator